MSTNFYHSNPKKLRSPLLGTTNTNNNKENIPKGRKLYFNINEDDIDPIDAALDDTLFNHKENHKEKLILVNKKEESPMHNHIDILEMSFKISGIFILASGGMLSLLELINVIRTIYSGTMDFGYSLIVFTIAFIGTLLANMVCLGFVQLIKTTKHLYLNIENQNKKIEKILGYYNSITH